MPPLDSDSVKGALGNYCPKLMNQSVLPPFCDGTEEQIGKACYGWRLAEHAVGKTITQPKTHVGDLKVSNLHAVDFMLAEKKILCVEDNPVSMKVIEKALSPLKRDFIKAKHGQEALDQLQAHPDVSLILLDISMPVMDGHEFVDALCEIYDGKFPYAIVLVSELQEWNKAKRLIEKGVLGYIKKPYTSENLFAVIKDSLEQFYYDD